MIRLAALIQLLQYSDSVEIDHHVTRHEHVCISYSYPMKKVVIRRRRSSGPSWPALMVCTYEIADVGVATALLNQNLAHSQKVELCSIVQRRPAQLEVQGVRRG